MQNKKGDVLYCNVDAKKIKNASPVLNERHLEHLHKYIVRRYMIHLKKDVRGLPAPWTKDDILKKYRFTNIRREHDKQTKWLIKNIVQSKKLDYNNKILNCILFRMYNKSETMELFGGTVRIWGNSIVPDKKWIKEQLEKKAQEDPSYIFFTNAFHTGGLKGTTGLLHGGDFIPFRMIDHIFWMYKSGITDEIQACKNQKEVYDTLLTYPGIGPFLAYQIYVDLTYIPEFPFSENEFVMSGPGCTAGLKYLFDDFDDMNMEEALFWLRDNMDQEFIDRGFKWNPQKMMTDIEKEDRKMNVMSIENCLCELSKYVKSVEGYPRRKVHYKGGE